MEPKALESCLLLLNNSHQQKVYQGRYHLAFLTPKMTLSEAALRLKIQN